VMGLIEGQKVAHGGTCDAASRYIGECPVLSSAVHLPGLLGAPANLQQVGTDT
jgi:hypothetical protein